MKMKSLMLLAVAVGCGLVAMLGVQQVLSNDRGDGIEKVRVLVARVDIEPGVPLTKDNVDFRLMPKEGVPDAAVSKPEQYEDRALTTRVYMNQVVCQPQLGEKGVFGATINIPDGMRVVTIPVNATTTHSGMLKPGDRVDVLATFQLTRPGRGSITMTKPILEYIEVFATDSVRSGAEDPSRQTAAKDGVKNVSLLVNVKQGTVLKLAESKGTIHLMLRSKSDVLRNDRTDLDENSLESLEALFSGQHTESSEQPRNEPADKPDFSDYLAQPNPTPAPAEKSTWKVTIYNGEDKVVEEVDLPEPPAAPAASSGTSGHWTLGVGRFFGVTTGK
jgi:pilus assembly protein CpaB